MRRTLLRWAVALLCAGLFAFASLREGTDAPADGLLYDLSLAALGRLAPPAPSRDVALVLIDRKSLNSEELKETPRVFLGPQFASLLDDLFAAGARVAGFDIIFAFSPNQFPAIAPNYDLDFVDALARHRDRIVLGRAAGSPIADPYFYALLDPEKDDPAAEDPAAVAYVELWPDADGVNRRVRSSVALDDGRQAPSLVATALVRAGAAPMPASVLVAPRAPLETMPAYSMVDVLRCAKAEPERLRAAFAGRIVLIGGSLAEEDRKRAPDRFLLGAAAEAPQAGDSGGACALTPAAPSDPLSGTVPGLFLHAAAADAVASHRLVEIAPDAVRAGAAAATAILGLALGFTLAPWLAFAAAGAAALLLFALEVGLVAAGSWLPTGLPIAAVLAGTILAYIVRFLIEERKRRRVQRVFGHYLSPLVVDRLAEDDSGLRLGGETRDISVLFADLSGFTALSGRVSAEVLMEVTNRYLALLVESVEATGGYIDKFIGDAVMAIWGAPAGDEHHAEHAARAALAAIAAVDAAKKSDEARGAPGYSVKIGINSGAAVVGNVGAAKRYNYTAVGETVNIAARLESVPGDYGCRIVVGPKTAMLADATMLLCELDWLKVKGKADAIPVYELMAPRQDATEADWRYVEGYGEALAAYRDGRFAEAAALWRALAHPRLGAVPANPPAIMAARAEDLARDPPAEWDGIWVKSTK